MWMNGINGNPCCHLLLKDRILKHWPSDWLCQCVFWRSYWLGLWEVNSIFTIWPNWQSTDTTPPYYGLWDISYKNIHTTIENAWMMYLWKSDIQEITIYRCVFLEIDYRLKEQLTVIYLFVPTSLWKKSKAEIPVSGYDWCWSSHPH